NREDLDFTNRLIHVRRQYSMKLKKIIGHTKGKTAEHVPMNQVVIAALSHTKLMDAKDSVFELSLFTNAKRRLTRLAEGSSIRPIRFHDLRHTFASCLAMAGVDL